MLRRSRLFFLSLLLPAALCQSCMFGPENGDEVCGANASVTFKGYLPAASTGVSLHYATSPDGPWTTFASATSQPTGITYAGATYYYFKTSAQIPKWASDGSTLRTYVRARYGISSYTVYLATFDAPGPGGASGLSCIFTQTNAGDTMSEAINACRSSSSPVVSITAPAQSACGCTNTIVNGNLMIDSAISAADHVCVQQVNGNMTITEDAPEVVPFPSLTQIAGDVDFNYSCPKPEYGQTPYERRTIDAPVLTSIGGSALLTARRDLGPKQVPQGLDAVTFVGGDITLTLRDANPQVFNGLTSHTGNVTIQGFVNGNLDINAGGSFQNLTTVTGDLLAQRFYAANGFYQSIQTVNGSVTVGDVRFYPGSSFNSLHTVTENLVFDATKVLGPPWATACTVGGELRFVNQTSIMLSAMPATLTTVQGLRLENNPNLADLSGTAFQLGAGNVFISGNPSLPQCEVDAFLAGQAAGGWTGSAFVTGTNSNPCP